MVYALPMVATISQVASEVGVRPDTIRYYERVGLLPLSDRSSNGYCSYGEEDVERLRFIRGAQRLGLKLRDIRELLAIRDKGITHSPQAPRARWKAFESGSRAFSPASRTRMDHRRDL